MGVDVYNADGVIDWDAVKEAGHSFGIVKATEGLTEIDARLPVNLFGLFRAGMVRGAYHFIHLGEDAVQQAHHFINALDAHGFDSSKDFCVLDVEDRAFAEANGQAAVVKAMSDFLLVVDGWMGRRTTIYLDRNFADTYVGDAFAGHPLWLAEYSQVLALPSGWTEWHFWQFSVHGTVAGIDDNPGGVDLDHWNGDEDELRLWAATGSKTVPLSPGQPGNE